MAEVNFKVETPKNLDTIFSLDCFHFNDMKGVFKNIYEILKSFGIEMEKMDKKINNIPDFDSITKAIQELDKKQGEMEKTDKKLREDLESNTKKLYEKIDENWKIQMSDYNEDHGKRIKDLEQTVSDLQKRPVASGGAEVDYSILCMKEEYLELVERLKLTEKRNIEQDDRLTNNELRIEKLESMINDPLTRIQQLEVRCDNIMLEMNNKVSVQDLYNEMLKKADINGLKVLEASLIRLNDLINDLANQFADRGENDKAHKLLQKNLKNLYDLFMSLKGEGNEDDPMFSTKGLSCASCAKGIQNMLGFRADHTAWSNFPFKDPGQRMAKGGQGFSKMYTKSQYEGSYYNNNAIMAHTSAADLNDGMQNEMFNDQKGSKMFRNQVRGNSASGARRTRPMTAKVNRGGLH